MKHAEKIHVAKFRPQFFTFSWHQTPGERQWPMYQRAPQTNVVTYESSILSKQGEI